MPTLLERIQPLFTGPWAVAAWGGLVIAGFGGWLVWSFRGERYR